jgi:hypothetical protein
VLGKQEVKGEREEQHDDSEPQERHATEPKKDIVWCENPADDAEHNSHNRCGQRNILENPYFDLLLKANKTLNLLNRAVY